MTIIPIPKGLTERFTTRNKFQCLCCKRVLKCHCNNAEILWPPHKCKDFVKDKWGSNKYPLEIVNIFRKQCITNLSGTQYNYATGQCCKNLGIWYPKHGRQARKVNK